MIDNPPAVGLVMRFDSTLENSQRKRHFIGYFQPGDGQELAILNLDLQSRFLAPENLITAKLPPIAETKEGIPRPQRPGPRRQKHKQQHDRQSALPGQDSHQKQCSCRGGPGGSPVCQGTSPSLLYGHRQVI